MRGGRKLRAGSIMLGVSVLAVSLFAAACGKEEEHTQVTPAPDTETKAPETTVSVTTAPETTLSETTAPDVPVPAAADYTITRVQGEADWSTVPVLPINRILWEPDAGIRAEAQLCCNGEKLFVHLKAAESAIRAENTAPLSPVYQDSCLEFFFMPEQNDKYFNFEINPNGCLCLQYGAGRSDRISIVKDDPAAYFDIRTNRTEDGWEVFYAVPLEFIRCFIPDYEFSSVLLANLYKCGDKTAQKHYLSWMPITLESPDFHCPAFFGRMAFQE